jgi:predicted nucleic acid-binding Zn ribbon protein
MALAVAVLCSLVPTSPAGILPCRRGILENLPETARIAQDERNPLVLGAALVIPPEPLQTRTTASAQHCTRCGDPVAGRRRNGFCSDRCRMALKRETAAAHTRKLFTTLRQTVTAIEQELTRSPRKRGGER